MNRIPEPFRIKTIERIAMTTREHRVEALNKAGLNPFLLRSDDVYIDLLTDSGSGAMSDQQWSAMMSADEAYAGSRSFYRLQEAIEKVFGYPYLVPAHQGRGAEQILYPELVKRRDSQRPVFLSNFHFDTTKVHIEIAGARAFNALNKEALNTKTYHDWKGNFDLQELARLIEVEGASNVAAIVATVTCNTTGGQPISLANLRAASALARQAGIPMVIDATRFAENAWFIREREAEYANTSIPDIVREMMSCADIAVMSSKKDGLVNIGGFCAFREDESLFRSVQERCVVREGFITYGGLAGEIWRRLQSGWKKRWIWNISNTAWGKWHILESNCAQQEFRFNFRLADMRFLSMPQLCFRIFRQNNSLLTHWRASFISSLVCAQSKLAPCCWAAIRIPACRKKRHSNPCGSPFRDGFIRTTTWTM
ncbi:tryptophanase [Variovorax sp. H27-G14]